MNVQTYNLSLSLLANIPPSLFYNRLYAGANFYAQILNKELYVFTFSLTPPGLCILRIDKNGNFCVYMTPGFFTVANSNQYFEAIAGSSARIFSNFFILADGAGNTYYWKPPATFTNKTRVIINPFNFQAQLLCTPITPPSYGINGVFVDSVSGLVAFEYVQGFSNASNIWASIYKNNVLINSGFIGNFPNGQDGFNRITLALPSNISLSGPDASQYYYSSSGVAYTNFGQTTNGETGLINIKINNGAVLNCSNSNNLVYVEASTVTSFNAKDYPQFSLIAANAYNCAASEVPTFTLFANSGAGCFGFTQNTIYILQTPIGPNVTGYFADGTFLVLSPDGAGGTNIYSASFAINADPPINAGASIIPVFKTARVQ